MESKIWHKWTYLWNRNRLRGIENRHVVAKGKEGGGGKDWELGISRCKLLYIEWIGQKVLLYRTGSYIQYPIIHVSLTVTTYEILSESLAILLSSIKWEGWTAKSICLWSLHLQENHTNHLSLYSLPSYGKKEKKKKACVTDSSTPKQESPWCCMREGIKSFWSLSWI